MKYAEKQLVRPQREHGSDYGYGRRSVLARNGPRQILHVASQKSWGGTACERYTSPAEIATWDDKGGGYARQHTLKEGRMTRKDWAEIAPAIYDHLKKSFPIELIVLDRTLLLDEPGELAGPPPRPPRKPPTRRPALVGARYYSVDDAFSDTTTLRTYEVVAQERDRVTIRALPHGRDNTIRLAELTARFQPTPEAAGQAYLGVYEARVETTRVGLERAARMFTTAQEDHAEAVAEVKALLAATPPKEAT